MNVQFFKTFLKHKGKSLGLFVAILTAFLFNASGGSFEIWPSVFFAAAAYISVQYYFFERQQDFSERIEKGHHSTWVATINGVKVGSLSDAQYATIQQNAFNNERIALSQCANLGRVAVIFLGRLFSGLPIFLFWFAVIYFYCLSPGSVDDLVKAVQTFSITDISGVISSAVSVTTCALLISYMITIFWGGSVGFINKYNEEINKMLRVHFNTPAEGNIKLHLMQEDADSRVASSLA